MKKLILFISIILLIPSKVTANDCNSIMNEKIEKQVIKHLKNKFHKAMFQGKLNEEEKL